MAIFKGKQCSKCKHFLKEYNIMNFLNAKDVCIFCIMEFMQRLHDIVRDYKS